MKETFIYVMLFSLALLAFDYHENPAECARLVRAIESLVAPRSAAPAGPVAPADQAAPSDQSTPSSPTDNGATSPSPLVPVEATASAQPATPGQPTPPAPESVAAPSPDQAPAAATSGAGKPWAPPDVLPAQPNWTWTTADGKTYENVVITKVELNSVSITHSAGVAHLDPALLPPDIQKQLNFDAAAAAAATAEEQREEQHPYYSFAERTDAQALARQRHWPLAWLASISLFATENPSINPAADATQMAIRVLKSRVVIIFIDGNGELDALPDPVRDQLFIPDDNPMPAGHHYWSPKVVFSNPDATRTLGRVCYTQMKAEGEAAIDAALSAFPKDPDVQTMVNGNPASETQATPPASSPAGTEPAAK